MICFTVKHLQQQQQHTSVTKSTTATAKIPKKPINNKCFQWNMRKMHGKVVSGWGWYWALGTLDTSTQLQLCTTCIAGVAQCYVIHNTHMIHTGSAYVCTRIGITWHVDCRIPWRRELSLDWIDPTLMSISDQLRVRE